MKQCAIHGWRRAEFPLPAARIVVEHREGDAIVGEIAQRYWSGDLAHLATVASSSFALVQHGTIDGLAGGFYFKRFLHRGWSDVLKHLVRASRARRALLRGEELRRDGFLVPRSVCLLEEVRRGIVCGSALVTEAFADAQSVAAQLHEDAGPMEMTARRRELLRAFAEELARLHGAGWHHADARLGNILCRRNGGAWEFCWLDNEGAKKHAALPRRERVHNLMQANMARAGLSLRDRLHFWRAYVDAANLSRGEARAMRNDVTKITQRRWRARGWL